LFFAIPTMKLRTLSAFLIFSVSLSAQKSGTAATPSPWGDYVEKDFPFFSSVLDARDVGEGFPKDNLTPRGLILNLGHNLWACFDTDLLRIACIWEGEEGKPPVTPEALAPGSYHIAGQKTKDGQDFLPKPAGKVWLANGIYPGWQVGDKPSFTDPREPAPSKEEVGRGALTTQKAFLKRVEQRGDMTTIILELDGVEIRGEFLCNNANKGVATVWDVGPHAIPLVLLIGKVPNHEKQELDSQHYFGHTLGRVQAEEDALTVDVSQGENSKASLQMDNERRLFVYMPPSKDGQMITSFVMKPGEVKDEDGEPVTDKTRWPQTPTTKATLSTKPDAYVIDDIPLPVQNPWKRNVRLADLAFLNDQGDAAAVTFDGDVWLISGLKGDLQNVTWKRFASGLHEPMSIVSRNGEILVFDRNGIWKLVDSNGDKECDRYEMFCNLFAQTAETREFPNSMKLGPKGELYISKGGQEGTTRGKHNGTVIKVAADGKKIEVMGYGLRQPFVGVAHHLRSPLLRPSADHRAEGEVSRDDHRATDVVATSCESQRCHSNLARGCQDGTGERRAHPHRLQPAGTLPRAHEHTLRTPAGCGDELLPELRLPHTQCRGEPGRRAALRHRFPSLGHGGEAPQRPRPCAPHGQAACVAQGSHTDGQGPAVALQCQARHDSRIES